jgi:hypothetical protein
MQSPRSEIHAQTSWILAKCLLFGCRNWNIPDTLCHSLTGTPAEPSWTPTTNSRQVLNLPENRHLSDQLLLLARHFFLLTERLLTSIKRSLAQSGHTCTGSTSKGGKIIEGCGTDLGWLQTWAALRLQKKFMLLLTWWKPGAIGREFFQEDCAVRAIVTLLIPW